MSDSSKIQQEFLIRLNEILEDNLENVQFGVSELAGVVGMSRSNLHRKVRDAAKISASQYIRNFRLGKAMELLQQTSYTVSEITYKVGFGSTSYFIKCFHEYYGFSPGELDNHQETNIKIKTYPKILKSVKPDTGDIVIWSIILILILNIAAIIILPKLNQNKKLEKTIAVLPFRNDSKDSTNTAYINGLMINILNTLSNIPDLKMRSLTTVENYRFTRKLLPVIARELNVNYVVEGSGQQLGNKVIMNIQLTNAHSDESIGSWRFTKNVNEVSDIDDLQRQITLQIASEISTGINPKKTEWYVKIPTKNLEALKLYWQGLDLHRIAEVHNNYKLELQAQQKFEESLELDSIFTLPMVQLGWVYVDFTGMNSSKFDIYLDSAFYYAQKAKDYNNNDESLFNLMGILSHSVGDYKAALENYKKINDGFNPPIAGLYFEMGEYVKSIKLYLDLFKQARKNEPVNYWLLFNLHFKLEFMGFFNESMKFAKLSMEREKDSSRYFGRLMFNHFLSGNYDSVKYYANLRLRADTLDRDWFTPRRNLGWSIPWAYLFTEDYEESYTWFQKCIHLPAIDTMPINSEGLAFIYLKRGQKEKADSIFEVAKDKLSNLYSKNWPETSVTYVLYAMVYSAQSEKEKAIEYLEQNKSYHLFTLNLIKNAPMFDNIRNEPEFQKILKSTEKKYKKAHRQIKELLKNYDI